MRGEFIRFAYAGVPLGLTAWMAFSLSFVFTNLSYLWPALSDPLGWGWNLFGTAGLGWTPYLTQVVPGLQVILLLTGLVWASRTVQRIASETLPGRLARRQAVPVIGFCLVQTIGMLVLLVG
jgi:hypothetical protein